jgi:sugar phosphate isomerase/epimerase
MATPLYSVPSVNWLRWPSHDDDASASEPSPMWPLERLLDAAGAAGFAGVGLDHYTVAAFVDAGGSLDSVADHLRRRGLVCTDVAVLPVGTSGVRAAAESLARLASITSAPTCIAAHYAPLGFDETVRELQACADVLAGAGAGLVLEFVSYGHLRTLAEAVDICAAVGWERCRLLVDAWHFFRGDEPWALLRSLDGDQIGLLHVSDGPRVAEADAVVEGRSNRLPVGKGDLPLARFAAAVAATGYRGVVSTEVLSAELRGRPPEQGARVLMNGLRASWRG